VQQIKIFEGNGNNEEDINMWLLDNPSIEIVYITMVPMFDRYCHGQGDICNQWISTIVIYSI
jgi:hypothetical protein